MQPRAPYRLATSSKSPVTYVPLSFLGIITYLVSQDMYSLHAYAFIARDFTIQVALRTRHL